MPITPGARTGPGLVIYRFGSGLYFANASRLATDIAVLTGSGPPLRWFCLDAAAIGDIDYSAAAVLRRVCARLRTAGVRVVVSNLTDPVRDELARYGLSDLAVYETSGEVLAACTAPERKDEA